MEQQTGSKVGNKYVKAVYCHPAYLTYMQSESEVKSLSHVQLWRPVGSSLLGSSVHEIL